MKANNKALRSNKIAESKILTAETLPRILNIEIRVLYIYCI